MIQPGEMETKGNMAEEKKDSLLSQILIFIALGILLRLALNKPLADGTIDRFIKGLGLWAPIVFVIVFALGVVILLPPRPFIGLGAIIFGKTSGSLFSLLGLTIGACVAFLSGRYLATDLARKLKKGRFKRVDEWAESHGVGFVFYMRLIFFGAPMLNYVVSSTTVRFRDYFMGSVIGLVPFVVLFSYVFDVLVRAKSFSDILTDPIVFALPALRIVGALLLMLLNKKSRQNGKR
ncbi:MAG: TVP38/TMEM64 family protein [bacterium]